MKRWLTRIGVFLVLGAIVNIAVAWGCAITLDPFCVVGEAAFIGGDEYCQLRKHRRPGVMALMCARDKTPIGEIGDYTELAAFVPAWSGLAPPCDAYRALTRGGESQRIIANGWPCLSLWWQIDHWINGAESRILDESARGGAVVSLPPWRSDVSWDWPRGLPFTPIWPGFAINTAFYAAILYMLFAAPFALRRWRRIKRGLCPKCGYDLRGSATDSAACPECGATR